MLRAIRKLLPLTLSLSPTKGGKKKSPRRGKIKRSTGAITTTTTTNAVTSSSPHNSEGNGMASKNWKKSPRKRLSLPTESLWNGPTDAELEAMFRDVENDDINGENDDDYDDGDDDDDDDDDDHEEEGENDDQEGDQERGENSIDTEVLVSQIGDILGVTAEYGSPLRTLASARLVS